MRLLYRKVETELYEDEPIKSNAHSNVANEKQIEILNARVNALQKDLETIKSFLMVQSEPIEHSEPLKEETNLVRDIAKSNQSPYKRLIYRDFEFVTTGRYKGKVMFDITDIHKLSRIIDDWEKYPSVSLLKQEIAPNLAQNSFAKLVYNYQEGYFDSYLQDYLNNTTFDVCGNHICINGLNSKLRPEEVADMIFVIANSSNKEECISNLIKQYSKTKPLFIKIIGDFSNNPKLHTLVKQPKKTVKIENNPEKRKEMGL